MSIWKVFKFDRCALLDLPTSPGCYVVFMDGELIYVGQSINVYKRFKAHKLRMDYHGQTILTPWGKANSVVVKVRRPIRYGDWLGVELRLLRKLHPPGNCVYSIKRAVFLWNRGGTW